MKSSNFKYIPALDHLRAFAACLIMISHGVLFFSNFFFTRQWLHTNNPVYAFFNEGHTAVALFMVLSGFIFTYGSLGQRISYFGFIKNRFLRVYPLYLFLVAVGAYLTPGPVSAAGLVKTLLLFPSRYGALNFGPVSAVFWTISVEFQFYLIFPFIMRAMDRGGIKSLVILIMAAVAARALAAFLGGDLRFIVFQTLLGRIDQFIIGMIAAALFSSRGRDFFRYLLIPSIFSVVMTSYAFHALGGWPDGGSWKVFWPPVEGAAWGVFLLSYVSLVRENSNIIASLLSRVGEMSYSMYLLHFSVWYIAVERTGLYIGLGGDPFIKTLVNFRGHRTASHPCDILRHL